MLRRDLREVVFEDRGVAIRDFHRRAVARVGIINIETLALRRWRVYVRATGGSSGSAAPQSSSTGWRTAFIAPMAFAWSATTPVSAVPHGSRAAHEIHHLLHQCLGHASGTTL